MIGNLKQMQEMMGFITQNQGLGNVVEFIGSGMQKLQAGANDILNALKQLVNITDAPANYIVYTGTTAATYTEVNTRPFTLVTKVVDIFNLSATTLVFKLATGDNSAQFGGEVTVPGNTLYSIRIKSKGIALKNGSGASDYQVVTYA
jgi:hypothetical protein